MLAYLQISLGGLLVGSLYGFAAVGLQFILGTTKKVHLAYGHLCLLSALATSSLMGFYGLSPLLLIPVLALVLSFLGWAAHPRALFSSQKWTGNQRSFLLVGLGLALVLEDVGSYIWALPSSTMLTSIISLRIGPVIIPTVKLIAFLLSLAGVLLLALFIRKSLWGKAFQAWETAGSTIALVGVDQTQMGKLAMAIGFGFAGLAGGFFALSYPVSIHEGLDMTVRALCLAIIAGALSPLSVFGIGLLLGMGESWISLLAGSQWSPVLSYTLFLAILFFRR